MSYLQYVRTQSLHRLRCLEASSLKRGVVTNASASASSSSSSFSSVRQMSTRTSLSRHSARSSNTRNASFSYPITITLALSSAVLALTYSRESKLHLEAPSFNSSADTLLDPQSAVRIEPTTSQPLPVKLPTPQTPLPRGCRELTLVGLGVRTVTFLGIRVYVAGLYVDSAAFLTLSQMKEWQGYEASWMQQQSGKGAGEQKSAEALFNALLDLGVACAIRIVPVKPTDYGHLRDGFTRAVQGRAKLARKANVLSSDDDEQLNNALQALKDAFPKASLPKGHALDLIFTPSNVAAQKYDLSLESGQKVLGRVNASASASNQYTLARQLLLAYMADKDEISKPLKQSVAQGFEDLLGGGGSSSRGKGSA